MEEEEKAFPLPPTIHQRHIDLTTTPTCGLTIFILEAGAPTSPLILLLHGFPELAYTWRKLLLPLAAAGYHVVAPDSRGYGRTTGWDTSSFAHVNLAQFSQTQLILDNIALVRALGHESAALVVGHDFGVTAAAACVLARPDLFRAAVFMSHVPTAGLELAEVAMELGMEWDRDVHVALARRDPPLKHYQWYNSTPEAAKDWENPPQGLRSFLRGYVHLKSTLWDANHDDSIGRLTGWTADQLARMPDYYIMPHDVTMPEVVANEMELEDDCLGTEDFMSDAELDVYVREFTRTGFQGMLNWYRSSTDPRNVNSQMAIFTGQKFVVPMIYLSGSADWGTYQRPGALEALERGTSATDYRGTNSILGCGHWPQTENPEGGSCNDRRLHKVNLMPVSF